MKAVLVLDEMPKECDECPLYDFTWGHFCLATYKSVTAEGKPSWCPLKEMPPKKDVDYSKEFDNQDGYYAEGWNECIEEIEK